MRAPMLAPLAAATVVAFHDAALADRAWPEGTSNPLVPGPWCWVHANHRYNTLVWYEEDKARRRDVGPAAIAAAKRLIDCHQQRRSDAVDALDEALLAAFDSVEPQRGARLNSETPGAMVDRLSLLALKIFHMDVQARRISAGQEHTASCAARLARLRAQRHDLACCFDQLLADAAQGRAYFKLYRQIHMNDDPDLNPYLYGAAGGRA